MSTEAPASAEILADQPGPAWFLTVVRNHGEVTREATERHFSPGILAQVGVDQALEWVSRMSAALDIVEPLGVVDGRLRIPLRPIGSVPRFRVIMAVDGDGLIDSFDFGTLEIEGVDLDRAPTADLDAAQRDELHSVFAANYRDPDRGYLEESLERLDCVATGRGPEGQLAGFALGAVRVVDAPRLPQQVVKLAGLVCVHPDFRRRGLASRLGEIAIAGGDMRPEDVLFGGRMAHPASYRQASARIGTVPRPDRRPSAWQRECGQLVADLYGIADFDPETFVCRGRGRPIGDPMVEVEVAPEEWKVFEPVDRSRGDSLLAIWFGADPGPDGWIDED